jgi:ribose/xylose/arabinose/galactoside ABC-type transport system permease subunit
VLPVVLNSCSSRSCSSHSTPTFSAGNLVNLLIQGGLATPLAMGEASLCCSEIDLSIGFVSASAALSPLSS